jgi:acyl carrier protein
MTPSELRPVIQRELARIAPDVGFATVDPRADIREALDIDPMDFLNFMIALHRRLGVDMPELDYPKLVTVDGAAAYLDSKLRRAASIRFDPHPR